MYNQIEAILSQYELEILQTVKGRDAYICTTNKGVKALVPFRGQEEKGEYLKNYLKALERNSFSTAQICENKSGKALTECEVTGERFLLKDHTAGTELNMGQIKELIAAMELLADYHRADECVAIEPPEALKESAGTLVEARKKRLKELIKVKNFIRGRKKKNTFDLVFLGAYENMIESAEKSIAVLEGIQETDVASGICHNDFNQHNILLTDEGWRLVNFEHFSYGCRYQDLVNFLRKAMEKQDWNVEVGRSLIRAYESKCPLKKEAYLCLYGLLLFPEKFWKISNHYMNTRKTWISQKDIEKLEKVVEQESCRKKFLENVFSFLS